MYPRNAASPERLAIGAVVQISDGAVQSSGVTITVRGQGGAEGTGAGTTSYGASGIVYYTPTQGETDFTSFVVIASKTGCIPVSVTVITSASATPGYSGIDWSKITSPTSTVNLSGTTVKTATDVETDTADIQNRLPAALVGGRMDANMGAISADSVAADNAEAFFDGTGYAGTNNVIPTVTTVNGLGAGVITAASIAASALDGKGNWNVGKTGYTLTPTTGLGDQTANITGNLSGSVGSVTGNVGGNVTGSVGSVAAGGITATSFASGAIDAVALATDAANEIRDAVWAKTFSELTGDPGATPTAAAAAMLLFMAVRNLRLTDSALGTDKIHNDAGGVILTAAISDAASIFTKAKYA